MSLFPKPYQAAKITASIFAASLSVYALSTNNRLLIRDASKSKSSKNKSNPAIFSTLSLPNFVDRSRTGGFFHPVLLLSSRDQASTQTLSEQEFTEKLKILQNRFRVGDYYVWLYRDEDGVPTSWEKYSVTQSSENGVLMIEMSTKFSSNDAYFTHHRMTVDLYSHLRSQSSKDSHKLAGFEYCEKDADNGSYTWKSFGTGDNVQAFEEKFDIFSMLNMTGDFELKKATLDFQSERQPITLLQSKRHKYTDAWYAATNNKGDSSSGGMKNLSGIALVKYFKEHSFKLIQKGNNEQNSDVLVAIQDN